MSESAASEGRWVRRFHASPVPAVRLVCFPHAGGSASYFFPVSSALRDRVEVLGVQYPGRQDRRTDPCVDDIGVLAEAIYTALRKWTDRPLAFFGHSMGAILAFEVAHRLQERDGVVLAGLFASGRRAPSRQREENVHTRDDRAIVAELRSLSGTDTSLLGDEEVLRMILPAVRSDYKAIETYRCAPEVVIDSPITAMVGDANPKTTVEEARDWSRHTTAAFDIQVFSGGHFYLSRDWGAALSTISDQLRDAIR